MGICLYMTIICQVKAFFWEEHETIGHDLGLKKIKYFLLKSETALNSHYARLHPPTHPQDQSFNFNLYFLHSNGIFVV